MKELQELNWELMDGIIPYQFEYLKAHENRSLYIRKFPNGFMNLPNADKIIDKLMFYSHLRIVLQQKQKKGPL